MTPYFRFEKIFKKIDCFNLLSYFEFSLNGQDTKIKGGIYEQGFKICHNGGNVG